MYLVFYFDGGAFICEMESSSWMEDFCGLVRQYGLPIRVESVKKE